MIAAFETENEEIMNAAAVHVNEGHIMKYYRDGASRKNWEELKDDLTEKKLVNEIQCTPLEVLEDRTK